jgi:uncharacterized protein YqjF (DUF2071 family)
VTRTVEPITRAPRLRLTRPVLRMRWATLTYLHWDVDAEVVARRLPAGLTPDLHDGRAWVGLVPFHMAGIALGRRGPRLPFGTFPETNVRTYVVGPDGGRGVYFHSLDITRLAPVAVAQLVYRLPYAWSAMTVGARDQRRGYLTRRRWPAPAGATGRVVVEVGDRLAPDQVTPLDDFLSARWALYAAGPGGTLVRARVDHDPWPLREARVSVLEDELLAAAGYQLVDRPPTHVRYGGDVTVRVGAPERV